jgi:serine/threonine protein phosphatase 1
MMRTYAIGDIHGHLDLLIEAHARIAEDRRENGADDAPIVHVGDLVDRGPNSQGVIEYLRAGIAAGENWVVLKGNHDRMFTGFLSDMAYQDDGLRADLSYLHYKIGGAETLASYGIKNAADRRLAPVHAEAVAAVPQAHRDFLVSCPTSFMRGDVMFVHAGVRPGVPLDAQTETDLVWIRGPFLIDPVDHGKLIVHGHTAIDRPRNYGNRVNIDSGAAYGGPLSAIVLEGRDAFHLTQNGRVLLPRET